MTAVEEVVRARKDTHSLPAPARFSALAARNTVAMVLAGGRGSRLHQLTDWRAKPSVAFGGKLRVQQFTKAIASARSDAVHRTHAAAGHALAGHRV